MKNKKDGCKRPYALPSDVVSATECTGITQFVPDDEVQSESFKEIYDIPMNVRKNKESSSESK